VRRCGLRPKLGRVRQPGGRRADSLITLVTVGWALFVLRERLTTLQHVGLALVVVSLVLVNGP
jgi:drug/metabolite transporter (DMT)-like permease